MIKNRVNIKSFIEKLCFIYAILRRFMLKTKQNKLPGSVTQSIDYWNLVGGVLPLLLLYYVLILHFIKLKLSILK